MSAATCLTMLPAIGAWVQVKFESCWIECEVIDVKSAWGKSRLQVKPIAGEGLQWVELNRVRYAEPAIGEGKPVQRAAPPPPAHRWRA